jgi:hypothetical protein
MVKRMNNAVSKGRFCKSRDGKREAHHLNALSKNFEWGLSCDEV